MVWFYDFGFIMLCLVFDVMIKCDFIVLRVMFKVIVIDIYGIFYIFLECIKGINFKICDLMLFKVIDL